MSSAQRLIVIYDKSTPVYIPGEVVSGHVILALDQPLNVDSVVLEVCGEAHVKWSTIDFVEWRRPYEASRRYVYFSLRLHEKGELKPGDEYVWPFSFNLPPSSHCPPSVEVWKGGSIKYYTKCAVHKSAKFSTKDQTVTPFYVVSTEDCNAPQYLIPQQLEKQKKAGWLNAGLIGMRVETDRRGYAPSDVVKICSEFDNDSARELVAVASLVQTKIYRAQVEYYLGFSGPKGDRVAHNEISRVEWTNRILPHANCVKWILDMKIPDHIVPTILETCCEILTVTYTIQVRLVVPNAFDLTVDLPVMIGGTKPPVV